MLDIRYPETLKKTAPAIFSIVRSVLPESIQAIFKQAEDDKINLLIDCTSRQTLDEKNIEADGYTSTGLLSKNGTIFNLSATNLVDMVNRAGMDSDIYTNITVVEDISPGEYAGALIHELTVHMPQHVKTIEELACYMGNEEALKEVFAPKWQQMSTKGQGGYLDETEHHNQTLDQTQGLGKDYYQGILDFVESCKKNIAIWDAKDNDIMVEFWETVKDDIIDQYQNFLKKVDDTITFGAYMKINVSQSIAPPTEDISMDFMEVSTESFDFEQAIKDQGYEEAYMSLKNHIALRLSPERPDINAIETTIKNAYQGNITGKQPDMMAIDLEDIEQTINRYYGQSYSFN